MKGRNVAILVLCNDAYSTVNGKINVKCDL
jgi:hypothetical protein